LLATAEYKNGGMIGSVTMTMYGLALLSENDIMGTQNYRVEEESVWWHRVGDLVVAYNMYDVTANVF